MATRYQRKIKTGSKTHLNISKSGASVSVKEGNWTINSKGYVSYRSGVKGLSFRTKNPLAILIFYLVKVCIFVCKWTIFLPITLTIRFFNKK